MYYAGHGVQIDGRNYLSAADSISSFRAASGMTEAMYGQWTIMAGLDDQVRTNILILDACVATTPMALAGFRRSNLPWTSKPARAWPPPPTLGAGSTLGAGTLIAFCNGAWTGRAGRRRRQQPVLGRADAPLRHAGVRGAADADAGHVPRWSAATKGKQVLVVELARWLGEVYLAEK